MLFRIIIIHFYILSSCTNNMKDINMVFSDQAIQNKAENVEINYFLDGVLDFTLQASNMESTDLETKFYNGFKLIIYDKNLRELAVITSDSALDQKEKEVVKVSNNVILTNSENEQLNTDSLIWNKHDKKIYTDGFVTISKKNQVIMGYGFSSDENFTNYSLRNITGTINL